MVAWSTTANAQQQAAAEKLFSEAADLMDAGEFESACPKLEESQRLDPAGGTVLLLAHCYENAGRTASAWQQFKSAISWARRDGRPEREEQAAEHAAKLESVLSRVALDVPSVVQKLEGLSIEVDGAEFGKALWGTPLPLDPGPHKVKASAPGHQAVELQVDLGPNADLKVVAIPMLEEGEGTKSVEVTSEDQPEGGRDAGLQEDEGQGRRILTYVVGGVGIVSLGVGTVFGIQALSKRSDAEERCPSSPCADEEGVAANDDAKTFANVANIGIGVGIVALGVATYLFLTTPDSPEQNTARFEPGFRINPIVGPRGGGVTVGAAF
jgi:hypothetical protein